MRKIIFLLFVSINLFGQPSQHALNLQSGELEFYPQITTEITFSNYFLKGTDLYWYNGAESVDTAETTIWYPFGAQYMDLSLSGSDSLANWWEDIAQRDSIKQTTGIKRPIFRADSGTHFDGVDDILMSTSNKIDLGTTAFSFAYTFLYVNSGTNYFIDKYENSDNRLVIGTLSNKVRFLTRIGGTVKEIQTSTTLTAGNYYSIVITSGRTAGDGKVYVNGTPQALGTNNIDNTDMSINGVFDIGGQTFGSTFAEIYMTDFRFYKKALTPTEALYYYNNNKMD